MSERLKVLGVFAVLGFVIGIVSNIIYQKAIPLIVGFFPHIFKLEWVISGAIGTAITLVILLLWVYLSEPSEI